MMMINPKLHCIYIRHGKDRSYNNMQLETISIAEPQQNRQHARKTTNAVNTRREGELKGRREEEGN